MSSNLTVTIEMNALERAKAEYLRWQRGLDTADCWEAEHFEEAYEDLHANPESLIETLTNTIEWLQTTNQDAAGTFRLILEQAEREQN